MAGVNRKSMAKTGIQELAFKLRNPFNFFIVLAALFVFEGIVKGQNSPNASSQKTVQGIPCQGEVKYSDNGKVETCFLSKDFRIEEFDFKAGTKLNFGNSGKIGSCKISKETSFYGQPFPANTTLFFNRWGGKLAFWLPEDKIIQGHLLGARSDGIGDFLYPNGKLQQIWLVNDEEIDGVPCTSSGNIFKFGLHVMSLGTNRMVCFYENGRIEQALLSRDFTTQGHSYKKGELIFFDKQGKIDLSVKK